jgi:hypothetical protein
MRITNQFESINPFSNQFIIILRTRRRPPARDSRNWEPCTADDFIIYSHTTYGNFCILNLKSESNISSVYKKLSVPGPDYGLSIKFFLYIHEISIKKVLALSDNYYRRR